MGRVGGRDKSGVDQMGDGVQAEGVRSLFNKALLGKWRWRLIVDSESLWGRVLRAKFIILVHFGHVE